MSKVKGNSTEFGSDNLAVLLGTSRSLLVMKLVTKTAVLFGQGCNKVSPLVQDGLEEGYCSSMLRGVSG